MKIIRFDVAKYTQMQIVEALTCPINRHAVRVKHSCDDMTLFHHSDWLIDHYIENGGAVAFAKRREEFMREVEIPDPVEQKVCLYCRISSNISALKNRLGQVISGGLSWRPHPSFFKGSIGRN